MSPVIIGNVPVIPDAPPIGYVNVYPAADELFMKDSISGIYPISRNVFNVHGYGASGNGITDDTTFVQDTVNTAEIAGGVVEFSNGTYHLDSGLTVTGDGIIFRGNSRETSIIEYDGNGIAITANGAGAIQYLVFENLTIRGNALATRGIYLEDGWRCTFINCLFDGFSAAGAACVELYGTGAVGCYWNRFIACTFINSTIGIKLDASGFKPNSNRFIACDFHTVDDCIYCVTGNDGTITDCAFETYDIAVYINDEMWTITGCRFEENKAGYVDLQYGASANRCCFFGNHLALKTPSFVDGSGNPHWRVQEYGTAVRTVNTTCAVDDWTDMADMSVTVNNQLSIGYAADYLVQAVLDTSCDTADHAHFRLDMDGVTIVGSSISCTYVVNERKCVTLMGHTTATPGNHVFKVQYRADTDGPIVTIANRRLVVQTLNNRILV